MFKLFKKLLCLSVAVDEDEPELLVSTDRGFLYTVDTALQELFLSYINNFIDYDGNFEGVYLYFKQNNYNPELTDSQRLRENLTSYDKLSGNRDMFDLYLDGYRTQQAEKFQCFLKSHYKNETIPGCFQLIQRFNTLPKMKQIVKNEISNQDMKNLIKLMKEFNKKLYFGERF